MYMACRNCEFRKKMIRSSRYQPKQAGYLDYCATTPVDLKVIGAFEDVCRNQWGNPSSLHGVGQSAYEVLEDSRSVIGRILNVEERGNIFFTGSVYSALVKNLEVFLSINPDYKIISTEIEHRIIFKILDSFSRKGVGIETLPVDNRGKMDLGKLESILSVRKCIIVYSPVNHETGSIQDCQKIYKLAVRYNSLVILDAVQAILRVKPEDWVSFCHGFVVSSHKIYAPNGCVLLYISSGSGYSPDDNTVCQEGGFFPGTENVPAISAFAEAVKILTRKREEDYLHSTMLTGETYSVLDQSGIEYTRESPEDSVPGIINISLTGMDLDMEDFFLFLHREKICISRFSACSGSVTGASSILKAMGRKGRRVNQSIRISLGRQSQRSHIFSLVSAIKKYLHQTHN